MTKFIRSFAQVLLFLLWPIELAHAKCDYNCTSACQVCGKLFGTKACTPPEPTCHSHCLAMKSFCTASQASKRDQPVHGLYCGNGNRDPSYFAAAIDALDEACKRHDRCWENKGRLSCTCDKALSSEAAALTVRFDLPGSVREKAALVAAFFLQTPCVRP